MATMTIPKVWANGEELTVADLNALFDAAASSINNVIDAQLSSTTPVNGAKFTDVSGSKIVDGALTVDKIGPIGLFRRGGTYTLASDMNLAVSTFPYTIPVLSLSVSGATILCYGDIGGHIEYSSEALIRLSATVEFDGSPLTVAMTEEWLTSKPVSESYHRIPFNLPLLFIHAPVAGSHQWTIKLDRPTGTDAIRVNSYQLNLTEFA